MQQPENQASLFDDEPDKAADNKLAHFEDCAAAIDLLYQQALSTDQGDAFHAFQAFTTKMSRFSNLSAYNAMLVMMQCPGALAVGGRKQWADINREVKADAIPIVILQAFGPVRFVFEFNDTEGAEIPGERMSTLFAEGVVASNQYKRTKSACANFGIEVVETDQYGTLLAGTAAAIKVLPDTLPWKAKEAARYRVKVNAKHDLPTRFATLAHELGQIYCGHLGADAKGRWPNRSQLTHEQRELEAEAVAWLVCQRTGVSPRSKEYLSSLATPEHIRAISAYAIFEAANRVESRTLPKK
jgi:hypothetical protein